MQTNAKLKLQTWWDTSSWISREPILPFWHLTPLLKGQCEYNWITPSQTIAIAPYGHQMAIKMVFWLKIKIKIDFINPTLGKFFYHSMLFFYTQAWNTCTHTNTDRPIDMQGEMVKAIDFFCKTLTILLYIIVNMIVGFQNSAQTLDYLFMVVLSNQTQLWWQKQQRQNLWIPDVTRKSEVYSWWFFTSSSVSFGHSDMVWTVGTSRVSAFIWYVDCVDNMTWKRLLLLCMCTCTVMEYITLVTCSLFCLGRITWWHFII